MLKENEDLISFHPGSKKNGKVILARIEVHNRAHVEQKILPRYFNHNSFASLRRQLNYFCFTRLGKGRQKGAAYCNEGVIVMEDILRLKRRPHVSGSSTTTSSQAPSEEEEDATPLQEATSSGSTSSRHQRSVSMSSAEPDPQTQVRPSKKPRLSTSITPLDLQDAFVQNRTPSPTIVLDLTTPSERRGDLFVVSTPHRFQPSTPLPSRSSSSPFRDDDVLAGCQALLSFSRGPGSLGELVV